MFSTDDSIVALATPSGRGGIGVVRISGPSSLSIASAILDVPSRLVARRATCARVRQGGAPSAVLDEVIATYFPAPHSYTGEHVVEVSAHGSPVVLEAIIGSAISAGARLAGPGEFTLRAFLNGKRDLIQAEAVADLIDAATPLQARTAFDQLQGTLTGRIAEIDSALFDVIARLEASLDFPEEGYHFIEPAESRERIGSALEALDRLLAGARRGRLIREGATVVVAGRPNVGKSSIFNRLLGSDRAIVTEEAGTTRDLVTEQMDLEGLAITLVDTAGCRDTIDVVEREGVARAVRARAVADLLLAVVDSAEPLTPDDERFLESAAGQPRIVVLNKVDQPARLDPGTLPSESLVSVSAKTGAGFPELRHAMVRALCDHEEALRDSPAISNVRHIDLLTSVRAHLETAHQATTEAPEEIVLSELQAARARLDEVVGVRTSEDLLQRIFERFCVGK